MSSKKLANHPRLKRLKDRLNKSSNSGELVTQILESDTDEKETFGGKIADKVAAFGGSWKFIIIFGSILIVWIAANCWLLNNKGFDPYPFILLNLVLSCIAAMQAPIIMMSQNRQEIKDRRRAENDYLINLKAELEIQEINRKLDQLIKSQEKKQD